MKLVKPSLKYKKEYQAIIHNLEDEESDTLWSADKSVKTIKGYIERAEKDERGIDLQELWVPSSTFWLIDNNKIIGRLNLRHRLNNNLIKRGGHIGYYIRKKYRHQGYGTQILKLALPKARQLGLKKVLITCDNDNVASWKIIEKNNGRLRNKIIRDKKLIRRYYIDL